MLELHMGIAVNLDLEPGGELGRHIGQGFEQARLNVCADCSPHNAKTDFLVKGESVIASAWTAVGLALPTQFNGDSDPTYTYIYDLIKRGEFPPVLGDFTKGS